MPFPKKRRASQFIEDELWPEPAKLELARDTTGRPVEVRAAERAKIILGLAAGKAKRDIAEELGIARQTVRRLVKRFLQQGTDGLEYAPRSGRPRLIQPEADRADRPQDDPGNAAGSTHWSRRSLAQVVNVSLDGGPDLAFARLDAASGADVQTAASPLPPPEA